MTRSQESTVGFASDTSRPESVRANRSRSTLDLVYAFVEGFGLGFMLATAILFLVYFGIIWKVNRHE